eukprot:Em0277g2a
MVIPGTVADNFGNYIQMQTTQASCYVSDTTPPMLLSFDLNLSNDNVVLHFSETVSTWEFNFTGITLVGGQTLTSPQRQLTGGTLLTFNLPNITFVLAFNDANYIKNHTQLATMISNTLISITSFTAVDTSNNSVVPIPITYALLVTNLTLDVQPPILTSFQLDLNTGRLTLLFTETVEVSTLNVTGITIQQSAVSPQTAYSLTGSSYAISPNGPTVVIQLSAYDLNNIKALNTLATSMSTTFLSMTSGTIADTSMNLVTGVLSQPCANYTKDSTPPTLQSFRLDMVNIVPPLLINLTFSETVRPSSIDPKQFRISVSLDPTAVFFNLTGGNVSAANSPNIIVTVTSTDLQAIRLLPPLGHYPSTTYLTLSPSAASDMVGLPLVAVTMGASNGTADLVPPYPVAFSLDMNTGTLQLTYSENIIASTLNITRITLQNAPLSPTANITLLLGTVTQGSSGPVATVTLAASLLNTLKQLTTLATGLSNSYLTIQASSVLDIAGNTALNGSINCTQYIRDSNRPLLVTFDFSLQSKTLTLYFNETVNANSLNPTGITLVNSPSGFLQYTLTGGQVASTDGTAITLILTTNDTNAIKALYGLAITNSTTFLSITAYTIVDNAGNPVLAIPLYAALPVATYQLDSYRPSLLSFDLNMNTGVVILHFNQTVNVSTLVIGRFTTAGQYHQEYLQSDSHIKQRDDPVHTRRCDHAQPKHGEPVHIWSAQWSSRSCITFTRDTTPPPRLIDFTEIDIASGLIVLSFSETVRVSTFTPTAIMLMDLFQPTLALQNLTGGTVSNVNSDIVTFQLTQQDLQAVQSNSFLCTYRGNCYISFTSALVTDMVGNPVMAINYQFPGYIVTYFVRDTLMPFLQNFTLDMNKGILFLNFSKPMNPLSLDATGIAIQGLRNTTNALYFYQLTGGSAPSGDTPNIVVYLRLADINALKASLFAKSTATTYLSIAAKTISDTALTPNSVTAIGMDIALRGSYVPDTIDPQLVAYTLDMTPINCGIMVLTLNLIQPDIVALKTSSFATSTLDTYMSFLQGSFGDAALIPNPVQAVTSFPATTFIPDQTRPILLSFVYDQNLGQLTLTFNDVVDTITFSPSSLTVQHALSRLIGYSFTPNPSTGSGTSSPNGYVVILQLSAPDFLILKSNAGLARNVNNTYITVTYTLINSMTGLNGVPIVNGKALKAKQFIPDLVPPTLNNFTLDRNLGLIVLTFSETVNITTFSPMGVTLQIASNTSSSSPDTLTLTGGSSTISADALQPNHHTEQLNVASHELHTSAPGHLRLAALSCTNRQYLCQPVKRAVADISKCFGRRDCPQGALVPDTTPPALFKLRLRLNRGVLVLNFTEAVNNHHPDISGLTLYSSLSTHPWPLLPLRMATSDPNAKTFNITLSTYAFIPDTTPPTLIGVQMDFNTGKLVLNFSETTNLTTFNPGQLVFNNSVWLSINEELDSTDVGIPHRRHSCECLKQCRQGDTSCKRPQCYQVNGLLAIDLTSTYLGFYNNTVTDASGNLLVTLGLPTQGLNVTNFTAVTTNPYLYNFTLDKNALPSYALILTFSEPIIHTKSDVARHHTSVKIKCYRQWYQAHMLTGGLVNTSIPDYCHGLSNLPGHGDHSVPATHDANFDHLHLPLDWSCRGHKHLPLPSLKISSVTAKQAQNVIPDSNRPALTSYTIDMNMGLLTLTFSETMDRNSFTNVSYSLLSSPMNGSAVNLTFNLLGSSQDWYIINVTLTFSQLNAIKLAALYSVATNLSTTYLTISSPYPTDTSSNPLNLTSPLQSAVYIPDTTPPVVVDFKLNISGQPGIITLQFSEPVNQSSISITLMGLYNALTTTSSSAVVQLTSGTYTVDTSGLLVYIYMSPTDLNTLKNYTTLGRTVNNTFIYLPSTSVSDVETVNVSTFSASSFTLQSQASISGAYYYTLTGAFIYTPNGPIVALQLSPTDLNAIKKLHWLATSAANTFLSVTATAIYDMFGLNLTAISSGAALQVTSFTNDTTSPSLLSFTLDLTRNTLALMFDETISYISADVSQITLLSRTTNATSVTLTAVGSTVVANDSTTVTININYPDIDYVKLDRNLAGNDSLQILQGTVRDMVGNPNKPQVVNVSAFNQDTVRPSVVSFEFDLNLGQLTILFNEPVNHQWQKDNSLPRQPRPQRDQAGSNTLHVNVQFLPHLQSDLHYRHERNYLNNVSAIEAAIFYNETTSPRLLSFDLDMNLGYLKLLFSETVKASSFNPTGVTLQSLMNSTSSTTQFTLRYGNLLSVADGTTLTLVIDNNDLNEVKARAIALTNLTAWLVLNGTAVVDMSSLPVIPVTNAVGALLVRYYIPITTWPQLLNFSIDFTAETLVLTFSETVSAVSINATQFTLQSTKNGTAGVQYTLTAFKAVAPAYGPVLTLNLTTSNLNDIKKLFPTMCTSLSNTYLSFTLFAASNVVGNPLQPRPSNNSLQAAYVGPDKIIPVLLSYSIDLNTGILTLIFSETIQASSINITGIGFQSLANQTAPYQAYNLTGGTVLSTTGPVISIMLSSMDLNSIKLIPGLLSGANNTSTNTYLSMSSSTAKDASGNQVTAVPSSNAMPVQSFTSDTTSPQLLGFSIDLNAGLLILNFSEATNVTSLDPTGFTLRNYPSSNSSVTYTLTGSLGATSQLSLVVLNLTQYDLNNIKALTSLLRSNTTYINNNAGSIADTSGNPVLAQAPEIAILITTLIPDTTNIRLTAFALDVNSGILTLWFSETVQLSTFDPTRLTLQRSVLPSLLASTGNDYYTLTGGSATLANNTAIMLKLNITDLNEIKRRPLMATSINNTYLSLTSNVANDTSSNPTVPITPPNAIKASSFVLSTTPPMLLSFQMDLNKGQLTLRFSETVNTTSLQLPYFTVQGTCSINSTNSTNSTNSPPITL